MIDEYITRNNAISAVCFGCNQQFSNEPCEPSECTIRQSIMALPTADVVPKSEFEMAVKEVDRLSQVVLYHDAFKADEIREIFEEIYETMNTLYGRVQHSLVGMHGDSPETMRLLGKLEGIEYLGDEIAELKKKYIGEKK